MYQIASPLYKCHSSNLRFLNSSLEINEKSTRKAIATQDQGSIKTFVRMHHFLLGAWCEVRLSKLLQENQSFNESELEKINRCSTQLEKWNKITELAFRRHYDVRRAPLSEDSLDPTTYHQYDVISGVINNELKDIIELRNRLAHGQWNFLLNSESTRIEADKMAKISRDNLQTLIFKKNMVSYLANIIHDLVVSPTTFERDFNKNYKGVMTFKKYIANKSYALYEQKLISSYQNGQIKKEENYKNEFKAELEEKILEEFTSKSFFDKLKILFK